MPFDYWEELNEEPPTFRPEQSIVIFGLPTTVQRDDLREIFNGFGTIASVSLAKSGDNTTQRGYVSFLTDSQAAQAIRGANGKFIGENRITVKQYQTPEDRIANNSEVIILSAGCSRLFTPESAKRRLLELYPQLRFREGSGIYIKDDPRQGDINSGGASWIFTAISPRIADDFINRLNELQYTFDGVTEVCHATQKLSKAARSMQKNYQKLNKRRKYSDSGASIQVFDVKATCRTEDIRSFFGRFGEIEELTPPVTYAGGQRTPPHYNILYTQAAEADRAIAEAPGEEIELTDRLARDDGTITVIKYRARDDL